MTFYSGVRVLVTGGTGLIGRPLVEMLLDAGADVTVVSLDSPSLAHNGAKFIHADLRHFDRCMAVCEGKDIVFHLAGIKGSPAMTARQPALFLVPMITFNTNMMEAARCCGVQRYLFTSSIGVYTPAEVSHEDDMWKTFPSPNDRFAGWAKRVGELQAEAYQIEYGWDKISIVRPANVYGPYDNFVGDSAMVIPSLIRRVIDGTNPLTVWGNGAPIRDFIYASDVARGMMLTVEKGINKPLNLGSGKGVRIKEIAEIIASCAPGGPFEIVWDTTKPQGDAKRLLDTTRAKELLGFTPRTSLEDGIKQTIEWYKANGNNAEKRYNVFSE